MTGDASTHTDEHKVGEIAFYWRPGCSFCTSLERSLARWSVPVVKHNIWDDPADAAFVRSVAGGNETVPTVRVGSITLVNPSARDVIAVARHEFPGLVETPPVRDGLLRTMLRRI